ncbi:TldD/PmbA family protein [Peribacillus sp. FSL H8-0477]|uniref:TldD/PmbA family protein n=1 Tax=Peribacillus sp. FSL H8-0477 TaxID=2921388 RepID=UPI0030F82F07
MNLQTFKDRLFAFGSEHGFADMELAYVREEKFACSLFETEIDSYNTSETYGIAFRGLFKGKMGSAFTEKMDEDSVTYLIQEAKENAEVIESDEPEEIFPGSQFYKQPDFFSEKLAQVSIVDKIALLKSTEPFVFEADKRVTAIETFVIQSSEVERGLLNSKGLSLNERKNDFLIALSVVVKENNQIKNGFIVKSTQDFSDLVPEQLARAAVEDGISQLDAKSLKSGDYPVVIRHDAAALLLTAYSSIFSAENVQKGQSLLKDKEGKSIASPLVSIIDDPFEKQGLACRSFDDEGVATSYREIVSSGTLKTLLYNLQTAKKADRQSTGHGYKSSYNSSPEIAPTNFFIIPSEGEGNLVAKVEEGILITGLSGLHSGANTISGDFSLAASGLFIEGGVVKHAIKQMTIAGNFFELLKKIEAVGSDLEFCFIQMGGNCGSPSLLIKELAVTIE